MSGENRFFQQMKNTTSPITVCGKRFSAVTREILTWYWKILCTWNCCAEGIVSQSEKSVIRKLTLCAEVAYLLADENTLQREFGVYESVRDNFPKYVVTMDEIDMSRNGIKHMNIRDFLTKWDWDT